MSAIDGYTLVDTQGVLRGSPSCNSACLFSRFSPQILFLECCHHSVCTKRSPTLTETRTHSTDLLEAPRDGGPLATDRHLNVNSAHFYVSGLTTHHQLDYCVFERQQPCVLLTLFLGVFPQRLVPVVVVVVVAVGCLNQG